MDAQEKAYFRHDEMLTGDGGSESGQSKTGSEDENLLSEEKLLREHGFGSMEELLSSVNKAKEERRKLVEQRKTLISRMKKQANLVDTAKAYQPYAALYKEYSELKGIRREMYYRKHSNDLDTAISYREGMENLSGGRKYQPKAWMEQLQEMKKRKAAFDRAIAGKEAKLNEYKEILEKSHHSTLPAETDLRKIIQHSDFRKHADEGRKPLTKEQERSR